MAVCALTASAFAQGTVVFQNLTGQIKQWTSASDATLIASPKGAFTVDLISAASGIALPNPLGAYNASGNFVVNPSYTTLATWLAANPGWSSDAVGGTSSVNGIFNNGTVSLIGIPGTATSAQYLIVGWASTAVDLDHAIANKDWIGESAIFTTTVGNPDLTPPGVATSLKATFTGMTLAPSGTATVPEPATFALFGLGAAALLIFRRRN